MGNNDSKLNIKINGSSIEKVNCTKFLGITISRTLDWTEHIDNVCKKLSQVNSIIYNVRNYLPYDCLVNIYNALALPHIMYCNAIWGGTYASHLEPLIKMQKRLLRTINFKKPWDTTSPLFKKQKSLKLSDIYETETLKIIHDIQTGECPSQFHSFNKNLSDRHSYNTKEIETILSLYLYFARNRLNYRL